MNLKQAKELVRGRLSDKRYEHTINVKKMAVKLAKRYGADEEKAALAAILHDSAKEISKDEMREIIRHERRIEFAGEGLYYNDIRRWMTAELVMNAVIQDYAGTDIAVRAFDPDRDYWWPVPADQILLNKQLEQNPNY